MPNWIKVSRTGELAPGAGRVVVAEGRSIALFNVSGTFHAIDNVCTHVGGPLGEGQLEGEVVTCPWHAAEFNVKTGAVLIAPARCAVQTYPVKVDGNDVLIELP